MAKKAYIGALTINNLFDENGVIDVAYDGGVGSDVVYRNDDGTITSKSNYGHTIYGQNLYGKVEEGKTYTFACEIVDADCTAVNLGIDCMRNGSRWCDYGDNFPPAVGSTIAKTFTIPSGCTSVVFGISCAQSSAGYATVKNIRIVEGAYTAETIDSAGSPIARLVNKVYVGALTINNLFDKDGVVDVTFDGHSRSDLVYKNADGTITFKSDYSTHIFGQDLYGKVEGGKVYTMACDIVSVDCVGVNLGIDCMRNGSRYVQGSGNFHPAAGDTIARAITVPEGCTSVCFGVSINGYRADDDDHITVKNIRIVEGSYTADNIDSAGLPIARLVRKAYIGDENNIARLCYFRNYCFIPADASELITADNKTFCIRGDET